MFSLLNKDNVLDAKSTFVSLSLFNVLQMPLSMLPINISNLIQANVAFNRISNFLLKKELAPEDISHSKNEGI